MEKAFDLRVLTLCRAFKRQLSCKSGFLAFLCGKYWRRILVVK